MCEQHLDLLSLPARGAIGVGLRDIARHVPSALVDAARHLARRLLGAAAWLEAAGIAVVFAGAVQELVIVHDRALAGQHLACGAKVGVALVVIGEVVA